jgi:hypothetical protein
MCTMAVYIFLGSFFFELLKLRHKWEEWQCSPWMKIVEKNSHRISTNHASQRLLRKVPEGRSPRFPIPFLKESGFWSRNLYFSSVLKALRQALNNVSHHFITQQSHLSFNLICIEKVEAGTKQQSQKNENVHAFWLQEHLIQSIAGAKIRPQFHLYLAPPTFITVPGQVAL